MAYSFHFDHPQEPISLNSYVEALEGIDLTSEQVAAGTAPLLMRLAANRELLISHLNDYLLSTYVNDDENPYSTQSFILYRCARYFIRINIWIRPKDYGGGLEWEKRAFSYEAPHNHNFDFLTANCLGEGYRTEIYNFDPSAHQGYAGEKVRLDFLENTRLSKNKVIFFRKFRDVHIQYAAEDDMSVSINLMISDPVANNMPQFEFDIAESRISNIINTAYTGKRTLFRLIKHLGNESSLDILHRIGMGHMDSRVRAFAHDAALGIRHDEELMVRIMKSKDDIMKREFLGLR